MEIQDFVSLIAAAQNEMSILLAKSNFIHINHVNKISDYFFRNQGWTNQLSVFINFLDHGNYIELLLLASRDYSEIFNKYKINDNFLIDIRNKLSKIEKSVIESRGYASK